MEFTLCVKYVGCVGGKAYATTEVFLWLYLCSYYSIFYLVYSCCCIYIFIGVNFQ